MRARLGVTALIVVVGAAVALSFRCSPEPPTRTGVAPAQTIVQPTEAPPSRPDPNIIGRDIKVVRRPPVPGEGDHPSPEILPRRPKNLVVLDCEGLPFFNTDVSGYDASSNIVIISWWDPWLGDDRSLTLLLDSPSCAGHRMTRAAGLFHT